MLAARLCHLRPPGLRRLQSLWASVAAVRPHHCSRRRRKSLLCISLSPGLASASATHVGGGGGGAPPPLLVAAARPHNCQCQQRRRRYFAALSPVVGVWPGQTDSQWRRHDMCRSLNTLAIQICVRYISIAILPQDGSQDLFCTCQSLRRSVF
jgi:hypothetical protein